MIGGRLNWMLIAASAHASIRPLLGKNPTGVSGSAGSTVAPPPFGLPLPPRLPPPLGLPPRPLGLPPPPGLPPALGPPPVPAAPAPSIPPTFGTPAPAAVLPALGTPPVAVAPPAPTPAVVAPPNAADPPPTAEAPARPPPSEIVFWSLALSAQAAIRRAAASDNASWGSCGVKVQSFGNYSARTG